MAQNNRSHFALSLTHIAAFWLLSMLFSSTLMAWQNTPYPPYYYAPAPHYPVYAYGQGYINPYKKVNYYAPPYPYQDTVSVTVDSNINRAELQQPLQKKAHKEQKITQKKPPTVSATLKKQLFIDQLLPYIEQENARLEKVRDRFRQISLKLERQQKVSDESKIWVKKLSRKYQVSGSPLIHVEARKELLRKIGLIPVSMTLAQAANESAWGQSRFATEANNLFGIWTYDEKLGIVPEKRDAQKKHLVRKFDHIGESVAYYMLTLNSHPAYEKFREIRQSLRENDAPLDGYALAAGLEKYSAKGELYIKLIQNLIRQNDWAQLDESQPTA